MGGAVLLAGVLATACVGPSRTSEDFLHKAVATADHIRSQVRTVELAVKAATDGKALAAYVSRVISQAEDDASAALGSFEVVQPPDSASDSVRDEVTQLADDALDVLADARIAARRTDTETLAGLADELRAAGDALEQWTEDNEP